MLVCKEWLSYERETETIQGMGWDILELGNAVIGGFCVSLAGRLVENLASHSAARQREP